MDLALIEQLLGTAVQLEPTIVGLTETIISAIEAKAGANVPADLQALIDNATASIAARQAGAAGTDPQ